MERSLRNRLTFGPIMLAALFGLLYLDHFVERHTQGMVIDKGHPYGIGGTGILALLLVVLPLGVHELAAIFAAEQVRPYRVIASSGAVLMLVHGFLTQFNWFQPVAASSLAFLLVFVMLSAALRRAWLRQTQEAIHAMAGTVLAMLYLGGLAWFLLALRVKHAFNTDGTVRFEGSTFVVLMILLVVKFTDIGAYFGGKTFGKTKLIPWLSPGKTWEGLFFGLITAGIVGALCTRWIDHLHWNHGIIFGVVIGGIGQFGDLLESLMKRDAEVKDSGKLIPGFGGILDVIDSPLLAAPFAYLMFSLF